MDTKTIGYPGTSARMPMRSATNLRGSLLIIPFARMMPQSRGMWLWRGRRYILLAGLKRITLTLHHATTQESENDNREC